MVVRANGEVPRVVVRASGEVPQVVVRANGEVPRVVIRASGGHLDMKIERSRELQVDRIDRQKLDKPIFAQEGERPQAPDGSLLDDTVGVFLRRGGEWRLIGVSEEGVENIADEQIAAAPAAPRASLIRTVDVRVNAGLIDTTEFDQPFEYTIGKNPPGTQFRIRWYATLEAWQDETPEADVGDAPIAIEWLPATPLETAGEHRGIFRYKLNPNTVGDFEFLGDIDVI